MIREEAKQKINKFSKSTFDIFYKIFSSWNIHSFAIKIKKKKKKAIEKQN